ncbi:MAG: zinc ribbon domain-containing protein [Lachnospiraceae bacterium]|nr:zinc ribbon domain-containing protein [Lachnospiraceae bacterium]
MSTYCDNCGAVLEEGANFCPQCGASIYGNSNTATSDSGWSNAAKTAAAVGGTMIGVSALTGLARRMTHRRLPPYMPPMGGPGGPGMGGHRRGF